MAEPKVDANVGVNINPKGIEAGMAALNAQMQKFIGQIETAGAKTNQVLKQLAISSRNLQSLGNFNAQQMLGPARDMNLGKQIRQMQDWQQGMRGAGDALQALRGRMAAFNLEAKRSANDKSFTATPLFNVKRVEDTAKAYGKVTNEIQGLRGRINMLSEDGRRAFQPMLRSLDELDKKNARIFSNKNLFDFGPELRSMQMMARGMKERVAAREKIEQKTRLNIETLREEARQILTNTRLEREAALAKSVRAGGTALNNRELIGSEGPYRRQADLMARLTTQTNFLNLAKRQLNAEYAKPVEQQNAARIQQLIDRYKTLQREIGQTIAMRGREARNGGPQQGGFFAGMSQGISRVTQGASENGGMFGAGALVGRVGTYALAATAIYGVITALRDAITFAVQFEDRLAQLQAISGSTAMEMDRLSQGIIDVSKSSANSILEITEAATIIAQAGYGGSELEQMLQNVVNLSAASGASPSESVDILTSALGAFQLSATESTRITDGLVAALNNSKLAVNQVQLALQYLGNTAAQNNITFEELVATTGSMADAGIRSGSTIATGLRQMLVDFMDPSEKLLSQLQRIGLTTADIDVKVLGLNEVLTRLRDAGFQAYGTLETRASAAYVAASANLDNTERLLQAMNQSGAAAEAAATRTDSLAAKWQQLLNTFGETGSLLGEVVIPITKLLVATLTEIVETINNLMKGIGYLVGGLGELTGVMGDASLTSEEFEQSLINGGLAADDVSNLMGTLGNSVSDVETLMKDAAAEVSALEERKATLGTEIEKLIMRQDQLAGSNGNLTETTSAVTVEIESLASRFPGLRSEFAKTEGGILGLIQSMVDLEEQAGRTLMATAFAQKVAAQAARAEANEEGVAIKRSSRLAPVLWSNTHRWSKADQTRADRFNAAIQGSRWNDAQEIYATAPANSSFRKDETYAGIFARIGTARQKFLGAKATEEQSDRIIARERFLGDTPEGRRLRTDVRTSSARATAAASQGSVGGIGRNEVARQIDERIGFYEKRYAEAAARDPDGAITALYAQGLSSLRAAANQLRPEEEKAKRERGGRGRGRGSADRAAERERQLYQRNEAEIAKEELDYKKKLFENTLEAIENAPDLETLPDLLADLDEDMGEWLAAESEAALAAIEKNKPTPAQRERLEAAAGRKAEELRIETLDKISETLAKAIKKFVDETTESIERQYAEAMRFTERALSIAQGRLNGLNNPLNQGEVPEYMKVVAQREVDVAADRNSRASLGANARRIAQYQDMIAKTEEARSVIKASVDANFGKLAAAKAAGDANEIVVTGKRAAESLADLHDIDAVLEDLVLKTNDLTDANAALEASYQVMNDVPRTFGEGMRMAVDAARINLGQVGTLGQQLINGLGEPLDALHQGFQGFFSDMLSGSVSVGQAFKNLAGTVIDAINQMIAVALAKKFFSLILTAFGGASPNAALVGDVNATIASNPALFWGGGRITGNDSGTHTARRMYTGGSIQHGMGTRDSTLIHAAKDEYLIRRPSALSLGKGFLDSINARGAAALKGIGQPPVMPILPQAEQTTNVYVVKPEDKPTLGRNDVLVILQDDVLQGGQTKQLIKSVSQGNI